MAVGENRLSEEARFIKPETSGFNILVILTAGLSGFNFAYANNAIAGSLVQHSFFAKFLTGENATSLIAGMLGSWLGGGFVGTVIQEMISSRWGRKPCTAVGAVILVLSSALTAGSVNAGMFIAVRTFNGIGAGIIFTNAPVYMAEISPPHTRGLLVGSFAWSISLGLIVSSLAALGLNFVTQSYQWRLQFVFLTLFNLILVISVFFLPESPRWLIDHDKHDKAWEILKKLHKSKHDPEGKLAHAEMLQIRAQVQAEKALPSSWMYILRNPHLRKRALISYGTWLLGQSTGIVAITQLLPSIFASLGVDTVLQLGLSAVYNSVSSVCTFITMFFIDRIGRVRLIAIGGFACSFVLLIEALLQKYYLHTVDTTGLQAALGIIFVFIVTYGLTIEGPIYVYLTEIWPTHLRSKGATIGFSGFFLNAIAYTSPASLAFKNIGWKYYLVFFSVGIITSTFALFFFPETKGLTLEEVSMKFGDHVEFEFTNIFEDAAKLEVKDGLGVVEHVE